MVIGLFTTNPDEVAAVQNDRFMKFCDGTSQNQWSKTPKLAPGLPGLCLRNPVICGVRAGVSAGRPP